MNNISNQIPNQLGNMGTSLGVCPTCGTCPTCGRGYQFTPPYAPYWMGTTVCGSALTSQMQSQTTDLGGTLQGGTLNG